MLKNIGKVLSRALNKLFLPLLRKWIAGEDIKAAVIAAQKLNGEKCRVMINYLGEHYKDKQAVEKALSEYCALIGTIKSRKIDSCVSLKLSQMGLDIDVEYCYENVKKVSAVAKENGCLLWLDMESSAYTDESIEIYKRLVLEGFDSLGVCLQANLKRTEKDLRGLLKMNHDGKFIKVRLCKGAYKEPGEIAFHRKDEIDDAFKRLVEILAGSDNKNLLAIATHDDKFLQLAEEIRLTRENVEVQMLKGIEEKARMEMASQGATVVVYLPYGEDAIPYCVRRVMKGKGTAALILNSVFRG